MWQPIQSTLSTVIGRRKSANTIFQPRRNIDVKKWGKIKGYGLKYTCKSMFSESYSDTGTETTSLEER
jgi:hypothetical protein